MILESRRVALKFADVARPPRRRSGALGATYTNSIQTPHYRANQEFGSVEQLRRVIGVLLFKKDPPSASSWDVNDVIEGMIVLARLLLCSA